MKRKNTNIQALSKKTNFKNENLNPYQYTMSLMNEGYRVGLLNEWEIRNIQKQVLFLLKDLIIRYTKGESSSVTIEIAEKLLASIFYSLDAYTYRLNCPEECITHLKIKDIKNIYEKGIELVKECVEESKTIYERVKRKKLDVPVEVYNTTLNEALSGFFSMYGIVFDAHNTMTSIDYPLVFDDMKVRGVFYIKRYLENLEIETEFCSYFSNKNILSTLINFGRIYKIDYKTTIFNIFELLLNNSLFSILLGRGAYELSISKYEFNILSSNLKDLERTDIINVIDKAMEKMVYEFDINRPEFIDYINRYKIIFIPRVINAVDNNSLFNLVLTDKDDEYIDNSIVFNDGDRMSDDSFRTLIKQIMLCESSVDKINMIKTSVHSMQDFIDLLDGDYLFDNEFISLFNTLNDLEITILGQIVFYEEIRIGEINLTDQTLNKKEVEIKWQKEYIKYIQNLDQNRKESIESKLTLLLK